MAAVNATAEKPPVCVTGANGFYQVVAGSDPSRPRLHHHRRLSSSRLRRLPPPPPPLPHPRSGGARDSPRGRHSRQGRRRQGDRRLRRRPRRGGVPRGVALRPCTLEDPKDTQRELLDPAVKGALNVYEAARRFNFRRVVLTSSISALVPNPNWPSRSTFRRMLLDRTRFLQVSPATLCLCNQLIREIVSGVKDSSRGSSIEVRSGSRDGLHGYPSSNMPWCPPAA